MTTDPWVLDRPQYNEARRRMKAVLARQLDAATEASDDVYPKSTQDVLAECLLRGKRCAEYHALAYAQNFDVRRSGRQYLWTAEQVDDLLDALPDSLYTTEALYRKEHGIRSNSSV